MRRKLPVLLKTNEPSRLPWGEIGKKKLLYCSTFDIEGLFHKKSHNGYSHFQCSNLRSNTGNHVQRGNVQKCEAAVKVPRLSGCYHQLEPRQLYHRCQKRRGNYFLFFNYLSPSEVNRLKNGIQTNLVLILECQCLIKPVNSTLLYRKQYNYIVCCQKMYRYSIPLLNLENQMPTTRALFSSKLDEKLYFTLQCKDMIGPKCF